MFQFPESAATDKHTGCFTAESKVTLEDGRRLNMSQLSLGDRVQTLDSAGSLVYSEVIMFLDREPEERMRFVTLTAEDGSEVRVTASHLVYSGSPDCEQLSCMEATYAGSVEVGSTVLVTAGGLTRAVRVAGVGAGHHTGVYAPLTTAGTILVDSVLASCYAVIDSQAVAHAAFLPVRWYSAASHAASYLRNLVQSPPSSAAPRSSASSSWTGVHWYPELLYSVARLIMPGHLAA